jgi:hypothetical protein
MAPFKNWRHAVATGVGLVLAAWELILCLMIGVNLLFFLRFAQMVSGRVQPLPTVLAVVLMVVAGLAIVTAQLLQVVGPWFCLAVPRDSRASVVASLVAGMSFGSLVAAIVSYFVSFPIWIRWPLLAAPFLQQLLFVLFVKRLAEFMKEPDIASLARSVLKLALFTGVLALALFVVYEMLPDFLTRLVVLGIAVLLVIVPLLVAAHRYEKLLRSLRNSLRKFAVLRSDPYHFYFWTHELPESTHIHVNRDNDKSSAKFWLEPVALAANRGFGERDLRKIQALVQANQAALLEAWEGQFGFAGE